LKQLNWIRWVRFEWDLSAMPGEEVALPKHYQISPATAADETGLRKAISSAFLLDPCWNPAIAQTIQTIQPWLDDALTSATKICLALRHGTRIIGASVISTEPAADNHLVPGPCILMEYRNRGFGTALLERSLKLLGESGVTRAFAIAREDAPVTKFLYPKFGGLAIARNAATLLAA
jgi:hypothetical protein